MRSFFKFLGRAARNQPTQSACGAALTVAGVKYQDWFAGLFSDPPWPLTNHLIQLGILALGVLLLAYVFWHEAQTEIAKARTRQSFPEITLAVLLNRITGFSNFTVVTAEEEGKSEAVFKALRDIQERAGLGHLSVFGRPGKIYIGRDGPARVLIPTDHWEDHDLDYFELIQDERGKTKKRYSRTEEIGYSDIWFDTEQVNQIWPPDRRRIRWINPIRIVRE